MVIQKFKRCSSETLRQCRGQAMLLTMLFISGIILGSSAIAGLLTFYQIKQSTDLGASAKAIFAADAGIEATLYCYFFEVGSRTNQNCDKINIPLPKDTSVSFTSNLTCENSARSETPCGSPAMVGFSVKSSGSARKTERILDTFICTDPSGC